METRKRRMSFALVECHVAAVIGGGAFVGWEIGMGGAGPCDPIGLNSGLNDLRRVLGSDVKSRHVALRLIAVDESLFQQ